jgi:hypothetical protein
MMRKILVVVLAVGLVLVVSVAALGQAKEAVGYFQAFVVDVTQETPVEVSIPVTLEDGTVITATAPLTVSVELRVRVDGPGSAAVVGDTKAEVVVATATPAVAVTGESELVDQSGRSYTIKTPAEIAVIQVQSKAMAGLGSMQAIGELVNNTDKTLNFVTLSVLLYDEEGNLLSVDIGTTGLSEIEPGQSSSFQSLGTTPYDDVASYTIQIEP